MTPNFTNHHAHELLWRFGEGESRTCRMSNAPSESGLRGKGHASTKGFLGSVETDVVAIERFGRIDRALTRCATREQAVLALAYGDAGAHVTETGLFPSRRWRAVAVLTSLASAAGPVWARRQKPKKPKKARGPEDIDETARDPALGSPAARWVDHLLGMPHPHGDDLHDRNVLQRHATELLDAAQGAFAAAYDSLIGDEAEIERHARVSAQ